MPFRGCQQLCKEAGRRERGQGASYEAGYKRCRHCERLFLTDDAYCLCCGGRLSYSIVFRSRYEKSRKNKRVRPLRKYHCLKCNRQWTSSMWTSRCYCCKSTRLDKQSWKHHCLRCNHEWTSWIERPASCRACGTPYWDKPYKQQHCLRCDFRWISIVDKPAHCRNCRSPYWHLPPNPMKHCLRCGRSWISKIKRAKHCNRCGSPHWDVPRQQLRCVRCDYTWFSRDGFPITCPNPKCHTRYWRTPRPLFHHYCTRCEYEWKSGLKNPSVCARCRNPLWDVPRKRIFGRMFGQPRLTSISPPASSPVNIVDATSSLSDESRM